jgi:hypothetical protein
MARPKKNNMDYFSHDNGMRNDRKVKAVRSRFGLQGYAVFNMLLELLAEADCLVVAWDETEQELIAGDFGITAESLIEMVNYFVVIGLMNIENGWLYSETFDERSELLFNKRTTDLFSLRSENGVNLSKTMVSDKKTGVNSESIHIVKESKVNKSKVNIGATQKRFIVPKIDEIRDYCNERGNHVDAGKFYDFYESKGWMIGKNKMKDWKAAVRNWERDKPSANMDAGENYKFR